MKARAFVFSAESLIALLFAASVISSMQQPVASDFSAMHAIRLEHDLLSVWSMTNPSLEEMADDARTVFPNQSVRIERNGAIIQWGNAVVPWVSSEARYFDDALVEQRVKVTLLH